MIRDFYVLLGLTGKTMGVRVCGVVLSICVRVSNTTILLQQRAAQVGRRSARARSQFHLIKWLFKSRLTAPIPSTRKAKAISSPLIHLLSQIA